MKEIEKREMSEEERKRAAARFPTLTYAEKQARAEAKRRMLIEFLASGEVYTTIEVAALLLQCSERTAARTADQLIRAESILARQIDGRAGKPVIAYGVTPDGLATVGKIGNPCMEGWTIAPDLLAHKILGQKARIVGETLGWTDWEPERLIKAREFKTWKGGGNQSKDKTPDYLATSPEGKRTAIEIERTLKTPSRYASIMASHLLAMKAGKWSRVVYITPDEKRAAVEASFARVEKLRHAGENVPVTDQHRARFRFLSFSDWTKGVF